MDEDIKVMKKQKAQVYPIGHDGIETQVMFMMSKTIKQDVKRLKMSIVAKYHKQNIKDHYEKIFILHVQEYDARFFYVQEYDARFFERPLKFEYHG